MKVLWFAVTPSMYAANSTGHNGGGWIESLEALVRKNPRINLGIAFEHPDTCFRVERDSLIYYPINIWRSGWLKLKNKFIYQTEEKLLIVECLKVIEDFKPDVIHVFGSEWSFGALTKYTDIPVVIHMQGSIPPYYNARFPAGYSKNDFYFNNGLNVMRMIKQIFADYRFKLRAEREERILRNCQYYMGRTAWDKNLTRLYAPQSKYFYCSEALREEFINTSKIWQIHQRTHYIFATTISSPLYKGMDLILKTAKLLSQNTDINFEWRIFGLKEAKVHERNTKIKAAEVNVKLIGTVSAEMLKEELLNADIFIHPSYIDNSPNSVCEAQLLGMPLIGTNVGGISSLVSQGETGLLVPSNDPFTMASGIIKILTDKDMAVMLGSKARATALKRHDPEQIVKDLCQVYTEMIADQNTAAKYLNN